VPNGTGTPGATCTASVTYTPNGNSTGLDSFTYAVGDGSGGTASATVSITVIAANRPPQTAPDHAVTTQGTSVKIPVLANDHDADGDPLTVVAVTQGANGTVVLNADGTVTYTPKPGFIGNDSFTYKISDGRGGSDVGTVGVRVNK